MLVARYLLVSSATAMIFAFTGVVKADSVMVDQMLAAMAGTLDIKSEPYMNAGKLSGCTLAFDAIAQDWSYRQGGYIKVSGNVGFLRGGQTVGANVKVVVLEIDPNDPTLGLRPSPPSRAYLIDKDLKTNLSTLQRASESDTPGALFSVFELSPTFQMVVDGLAANELTVAFNSKNGATDIQLKLELDVQDVTQSGERIRSDKMKSDFARCLQALADTL